MFKKISVFLLLVLLIVRPTTIFAGDIPEVLQRDDNAKLYIATVLSADDRTMTVIPIEKIKGDVNIANEKTITLYTSQENLNDKKSFFRLIGNNGFKPDETCLIAEIQGNDNYIFKFSGQTTETMKIEGIEGAPMWETVQLYLNEGQYEKAEQERLARLAASVNQISTTALPTTEQPVTNEQKTTSSPLSSPYLSIILIVVFLLLFTKRTRKKPF